MGKKKVSSDVLKARFAPLFKNSKIQNLNELTVKEFEDNVLPVIKKLLLREAETAAPLVAEFFQHLKLSSDSFATSFVPIISGSLTSASDDIRHSSVEAVVAVGSNITEPKVVDLYLKQLFDLLKVNNSKLPQKTSIVNAISGVCENAKKLTGPYPETVTSYFATFLPTESNEVILKNFWSAFGKWTLNAGELTTASVGILKKGVSTVNQKSTALRIALLLYDRYNTVAVDAEIFKTAQQVAKIAKTEANVNLDFISAAALILRHCILSEEPIDASLFTTLNTNDSINREKVYHFFAGEEGKILLLLSKRALLSSIRPSNQSYPAAVIKMTCLTMIWPDYKVRLAAKEIVQNLCMIEGCKLRSTLIEGFLNLFHTKSEIFDEVYHKASIHVNLEEKKKVPSAFFVQALSLLLPEKKSELDSDEDLINFIVSALFLSSAPRLVESKGDVWIHWLARAKDFNDLVHSEAFCKIVFERILKCNDKELRSNVIKLLLSIHFKNSEGDDTGDYVANKFWTRFSQELFEIDTAKYLEITDKEAGIFKTKEGELYNQEAVELASDLYLDETKLKRENKAYSVKEQKAEIEVRKANALKLKQEGKLSEKQKKVKEEELKRETEVRKQMKELFEPIETKLTIIAEAARSNPKGACFHVNVLYEIVVPLLKSHLVSSVAADTFMAFCVAFFEPSTDSLGARIGIASLRVLGALGYADVTWPETLIEQLTRVFNSLTGLCIAIDFGEEIMDEEQWQDSIDAWKLSFLVPLIEKVLPNQTNPVEFQVKVSSFLKSAINGNFLSSEDIILPPIVRLNKFLVKQMCDHPTSEIFEDLKQTIFNYCTLIQQVEEPSETVKEFFMDVVKVLKNPIEVLRLLTLKWLSLDDTYLLKQCAVDPEFKMILSVAIYLERFDLDENCVQIATNLWALLRFIEVPEMGLSILKETFNHEEFVQAEASEAIRELGMDFAELIDTFFNGLFDLYNKYLIIVPAVTDNVGRIIKPAYDPIIERIGVSKALIRLADIISLNMTQKFVEQIGEKLNERDGRVHSNLRSAAIVVIKRNGQQSIGTLLPYLETTLTNAPKTEDGDHIQQGLVVLLGTLGMYLGNEPNRVLQIFKTLIEALSTPSESVQRSVANCLPDLVVFIETESIETLEQLLHIMEVSANYGERRGAAYGIAAIVRGLRAYVIVEVNLLKKIETMVTSKSNHNQRESALLIMELLFTLMGHESEPFMPGFITHLLLTYGDTNANVRKSAADAGAALMAALSQHGAKLIVPIILDAAKNDNWRTKKAAAELLGAVSQCAPRQLSSCLPKVVPTLVELLADSHHEVQKAGTKALKDIAQVIRNPEIMSIAPHLITGLVDPVSKTTSALETVVNTRFIHYMDPPSLALIMPIIRRAFSERNTKAREMSSQIIANIYNLTDKRDMEAYLDTIIPGLQSALLDPVPEVRTVAARAFGAVLRYSSENVRDQVAQILVPWLKQRLVSTTSMVDRSGAAQGLAEAMAAFGEEYLDKSMPEILAISENPKTNPYVRDGYLLLFIYLPIVLRDRFVNYLPVVVSPLLISLADENEVVRTTALKAGQQLINLYVNNARTALLPQLQKSLFHENWRIRHAAVQLIGDYLFNISGVSGKMSSDTNNEDDTLGIEAVNKAILQNVGKAARDEILSGLYLCRQDVALIVRQAASHVWKVVVPNTPRALRDIMGTLFDLLLKCLASTSKERVQTAARCLGEVVKKMGERLLDTILPILRNNLETTVDEQRLGVAEALNEVLQSCSRETLSLHAGNLMIILNRCLTDSASIVRAAAAPPFNLLMQIVGPSAVDEIVMPMVDKFLKTSDADTLDALCMIVNVNPKSFLPPILKKLTKSPINAFGLCKIAAASGSQALNKYLPQFLDPLLSSRPKKDEMDEFITNCLPALMAITETDTMQAAISQLYKSASKSNNLIAILLLKKWVENSKALFDEQVVEEIIPDVLMLYGHENDEIVNNSISIIETIIRQTKQGHAIDYLFSIQKTMDNLVENYENEKVLGFEKSNGFGAFQQVLKEAFFAGTNSQKESAISIANNFTFLATSTGLAPHAIFLAGPIIRSIGDRFLLESRKSALSTLKSLFEKVSTNIRPFVPQIQTELLKLMQIEKLHTMKDLFAETLSYAIFYHMKSEIVFNDLLQLMAISEDAKILELGLLSLAKVVPKKKENYGIETMKKVEAVAKAHSSSTNPNVAESAKLLLDTLM